MYDPGFYNACIHYLYLVHEGVRFGFVGIIERTEGVAEIIFLIFPEFRTKRLAKNRLIHFFESFEDLGYHTLFVYTHFPVWVRVLRRLGFSDCESPLWAPGEGEIWLKRYYGEERI